MLISQTQLIGSAWTTSLYGSDGHGSVRFLMDASGTVTDTYDYDAFGILIHQTGATPNVYLYSGAQFDPDLGLYYQRARYLNTSTGRFWSMDSDEGDRGSPVSLHKYLYSDGNPANVKDPSGNDGLADISIAQAINLVLNVMSVIGAVQNTYQAVKYGTMAVGEFNRGDMWDGGAALALSVIHVGFAALSILGLKGGAPPPPLTGIAVAGGAAGDLAVAWRVMALSPAFENWVWQRLLPTVIGAGGVFLASSTPGHTADWELRDSGGRIRTRGTAESGGTGKSNPTWPEQLASHTEPKILNQIEGNTAPGDIVTIRGTNAPCAPGQGYQGCTILMKLFAQGHGVKILYSVGDSVWEFRPDGTVVFPEGYPVAPAFR